MERTRGKKGKGYINEEGETGTNWMMRLLPGKVSKSNEKKKEA